MKKLILVRHGKSSWEDLRLADHDRPLAKRGLRDAPTMALRLKERGIVPDLLLTSTAERAAHTAKITAQAFDQTSSEFIATRELYHSSYRNILSVIQSVEDRFDTVCVFGHNPGFNDLIDHLGEYIENLPTSGQYGFEADIQIWKDFGPNTAEALFFDYPKKKIS